MDERKQKGQFILTGSTTPDDKCGDTPGPEGFPSLAVGALGLSFNKLISDLKFFGLLFESLVIRDLRVYADARCRKVFLYRDSRGLEADAVMEYANCAWGPFEAKL